MINRKRFGETIRELRTKKNLSQKKLAEFVGIDHTFISKLEQGQRLPSLPVLVSLSKALNVSVENLLKNAIDPEDRK